jgi:carbamoylphosphate synthase small subunit
MSINAIDPSAITESSASGAEQAFNSALEGSPEQLSDAEFTDQLVSGAVTVAGQMIIMPRANEMLNEAMSDDE